MPFAYDPTGVLPTNLVTEEIHLIPSAGQYGNFRVILPTNGPFFLNSFGVSIIGTGGVRTTLIRGTHWLPTHHFGTASRSLDKPINGGIAIIDPLLQGNVVFSYQTIGGNWVLGGSALATILSNVNYNPVQYSWEQVANYPDAFPVGPHSHPGFDVGTWQELIDSVSEIAAAITARPIGASIVDLNNAVNNFNTLLLANAQQYNLQHISIISEVSGMINAAIAGLGTANQGSVDALTLRVNELEAFETTQGQVNTNLSSALSSLNTSISNLNISIGSINTTVGGHTTTIGIINNTLGTLARKSTVVDTGTNPTFLINALTGAQPDQLGYMVSTQNQVITIDSPIAGVRTFYKKPNVTSYRLVIGPSLNSTVFRVLDQNTNAILTDTILDVDHNGMLTISGGQSSSYLDVGVIT